MPEPSDDATVRVDQRRESSATLAGLESAEAAAERVALAMAEEWKAGRHRPVEQVLALHPEIRDNPRAAVRLIYEEICLRQDEGPGPPTLEMMARFPRYRDELRILLAGHRLIADDRSAPKFPRVGETLGDARLVAELGRGAMGRVFLATQTSLADRPVVLKVAPRRSGSEHLALARLQHPHIVPLYGATDHPGLGLRSLCMPYHGSLTLARLAEALEKTPPGDRTGLDILKVLDDSRKAQPVEIPGMGQGRANLKRWDYTQTVAWIGSRLALALAHAHGRNLIHFDIKPTNIILAADGQPMLLDFHLARKPIRPDDPEPGSIGGTATFMSPEQAETLDRARAGKGPRSVVDGRSDLYSLGLVLYQILGGPWPPPPLPRDASRALRKANRAVSPGLAAILGKCLEPRPEDRYPDAGALAEDLGRHLADQPLQGVPNRSRAETWRKWRRRRPSALGWIATSVGFVATAAVLFYVLQLDLPLKPVPQPVPRIIADPTVRAENARKLAEAVARYREAVASEPPLDPRDARDLAEESRNFWANRRKVANPEAGPLPEATERQIRADLIALAILSVKLEALAEPGDPDEARRAALARLDEAAALGTTPELEYNKRKLIEGMMLRRIIPPGKANPMPGRDRPSPDGPSLRAPAPNPPRTRAG